VKGPAYGECACWCSTKGEWEPGKKSGRGGDDVKKKMTTEGGGKNQKGRDARDIKRAVIRGANGKKDKRPQERKEMGNKFTARKGGEKGGLTQRPRGEKIRRMAKWEKRDAAGGGKGKKKPLS